MKNIFVLLSLILASGLQANTRQLVEYEGATPFKIVTTDESQETNEKPGVYRRSDSDSKQWELIIPGETLQEKNRGGVFKRLSELNTLSNRYETISIVDGLISIYHSNSSAQDINSYIRLGSSDYPLFDPHSVEDRFLPKIQDVNDVSLIVKNFSNDYVTLIVSIKFPETQITGNGITFFVNLRLSNANSNDLKLATRATIVDYQYYDPIDLNKRIKENMILSENLMRRTTFVNKGDPDTLVKWKEDAFAEYKKQVYKWNEMPYIDMKTGIPSVPQKVNVPVNSFITQSFDLVSGNDEIVINGEAKPGRVDYIPGTKKFAVFKPSNDSFNAIMYVGQRPYFVNADGKRISLPSGSEHIPVELSFFHDSKRPYFIVSEKYSNGTSATWFIALKVENVKGNHDYVHVFSSKLTNVFYDYSDLLQRITDDSKLMFDGFTPVQKTPELYEQEYRESRAHYALVDSVNANELLLDFNKPIERYQLTETLYYLVYDDAEIDRKRKRTGFYELGKKDKVVNFINGKLIKGPLSEKYLWASKDIKFPNKKLNYKVLVYGLDQNYLESASKAKLLVVIYDEDERRMISHLGLDIEELENLRSLKIIGVESNTNELAITYSTATEKSHFSKTVLVDVTYDQGKRGYTLSNKKTQLFNDIALDDSEWQKRIKIDVKGQIYWVIDPEIQENHRNFALKRLNDEQKVYPNRAQFKDISFKLADKDQTLFGQTAGGQWQIQSYSSIHHPAFQRLAKVGSTKFKTDLFGNLDKIISELSSKEHEAKHMMLVVPEELKSYVYNVVMSRWLNAQNKTFSKKNSDLSFNIFQGDKISSQAEIFDIYDGFDRQSKMGKRVFLLADIEQIINMDRPKSQDGDEVFKVEHIGTGMESEGDAVDALTETDGKADVELIEPHILYLMSTEGEKLDLVEYDKRGREFPKKVSTLIVTTQSELGVLGDYMIEDSYGLFENFETVELESPSLTHQRKLLESVFKRADIERLMYRFDASRIKKDDPIVQKNWFKMTLDEQAFVKEAVLSYLATRIRTLANENGIHPTIAIAQMIQNMADTLLNDPMVRSKRVVDQVMIERLLANNFKMPINLSILPDDDPLKIISGPSFLQRMQKHNHTIPIQVLNKIKQIRLGQTRKDPTRAVPSSIILIGPTGTGKTSFWFALMKALGNETFDITRSRDNTNARAFYINLDKVVSGHDGGNNISVEKVLDALDEFLALPNGARGDILIDDAHKGSPSVRGKIFAKIFELIDSEDGMYRVTDKYSGEIIERPVVNLNIMITMNPTENNEKLDKYRNKDLKSLSIDEQIIATFDSEESPFDNSHLKRFGAVLEFTEFPSEAKGPRLAHDIKDSVTADFNTQNRLSLYTPSYIDQFLENFPQLDARSFLSKVTQSTLQKSQEEVSETLLILSPVREDRRERLFGLDSMLYGASNKPMSELGLTVGDFVDRYTQALPIGRSPEANFRLLQLLVDSLRTQIYEVLFRSIGNRLEAQNNLILKNMLPQYYKAISDHLKKHPYLPLSTLNLDPSFYGHNGPEERMQFLDLLNGIDGRLLSNTNYYPNVPLFERTSKNYYKLLTDSSYVDDTQLGRSDVMANFKDELVKKFTGYLESLLHVDGLENFSGIEWVEQLTENSNIFERMTEKEAILMNEIFTDFAKFSSELQNTDLYEVQLVEEFTSLYDYDHMKLFLYTVDKSISRIEWHSYLDAMIKILTEVSSNMVAGQKDEVQEYLFKNRYSLIWPKSHEGLLMLVDNTESLSDLKRKGITPAWGENRFYSECEKFLRK